MSDTTFTSPWLTIAEAGDYARVGERTIRRAVESGALQSGRIGQGRYGDPRIHRDHLDEWIARPRERRRPQAVLDPLQFRVTRGGSRRRRTAA